MSTSIARSKACVRLLRLSSDASFSGIYSRAATRSLRHMRPVESYVPAMAESRNIRTVSSFNNSSMSLRFFSDKAEGKQEDKPEEAPGVEEATVSGEQAATEPTTDPSTPPEEPSREQQLEAEIKSLKDQLLRSLAEQDNTRRIAQRDVESARQFAIKSFAKALLDVSDNLSRALEAVPKEEIDKKGSTLTTLYEGIEMTERGLNKVFESHGLVRYGKEGELFDPNQHEALYEYPDPSKKPGTVGQVVKSGFLLNKRVLRPAEVGVVKKVE